MIKYQIDKLELWASEDLKKKMIQYIPVIEDFGTE